MNLEDHEAMALLTEDERAIFCRADSREAMRSLAYARLLLKRQLQPRIASAAVVIHPETYRYITKEDVMATPCPVCAWMTSCNPGVSFHGMAHFNGGGSYHAARVTATVKRLEHVDAAAYLFNVKMIQGLEEINGSPVTLERFDMNLVRERGYEIKVKYGPETGLHSGVDEEVKTLMDIEKLVDELAAQVKP